MATLTTAARNAACDAIVDLVDLGNQAGRFLLKNSATIGAGTTLSTLTLNDPSFGAAATGVATLIVSPAISDTSADASGTASGWEIQSMNSGTPTAVMGGTIGTGSEDLDIDNATIVAGQTVNLNAITVTVPAS